MGNNKTPGGKSRRDFLSLFSPSGKKAAAPEMVKMLTSDGKLVEVDKAMLDKVAARQKASNQQIFDWMKNPSKDNA
jgi:hypothetical protein